MFKKASAHAPNLKKWYPRFCCLCKGLEAIYIHVYINIPMFIVLYHWLFLESWNIAGWTTSILLHTKAAGKHRNFKRNRPLYS